MGVELKELALTLAVGGFFLLFLILLPMCAKAALLSDSQRRLKYLDEAMPFPDALKALLAVGFAFILGSCLNGLSHKYLDDSDRNGLPLWESADDIRCRELLHPKRGYYGPIASKSAFQVQDALSSLKLALPTIEERNAMLKNGSMDDVLSREGPAFRTFSTEDLKRASIQAYYEAKNFLYRSDHKTELMAIEFRAEFARSMSFTLAILVTLCGFLLVARTVLDASRKLAFVGSRSAKWVCNSFVLSLLGLGIWMCFVSSNSSAYFEGLRGYIPEYGTTRSLFSFGVACTLAATVYFFAMAGMDTKKHTNHDFAAVAKQPTYAPYWRCLALSLLFVTMYFTASKAYVHEQEAFARRVFGYYASCLRQATAEKVEASEKGSGADRKSIGNVVIPL